MRRIVSHVWVSVATYILCVTAVNEMGFGVIIAAPFVVSAALGVWFLGSYFASRRWRYITDTDALNKGECPSCSSTRLMEVTSSHDPKGQRRVICTNCDRVYAIRQTEDDFITIRLGRARRDV